MPKEFTIYGQKIIVNDTLDLINQFRLLIVQEAKKASYEFGNKYIQYGNIETLLERGYQDGLSIIGDVIQRDIIVNMEEEVYKIQKLLEAREKLYTTNEVKEALESEIFNAVASLVSSCVVAFERHGLINARLLPTMNADIDRVNAIIRNIPYMDQDDLMKMLPDIVLPNPYNLELYHALYSRFGDPDGELSQMAKYFGIEINE